jgi:hypothetical protein
MVALVTLAAWGCGDAPGEAGGDRELEQVRAEVRGGGVAGVCDWPAVVALDLACSGVLVHPQVVVYAAHCGLGVRNIAFGERSDQPARIEPTLRCAAHREAALGNGLDLAYCILQRPVADIDPIPIAANCERSGIVAGAAATLVGFGSNVEGAAFGIKRSAQVTVTSIGQELLADSRNAAGGACVGDSGAPLVFDVAGRGVYRVGAIVSGDFNGADEWVQVFPNTTTGFWEFRGAHGGGTVFATAQCLTNNQQHNTNTGIH